MHKSVRLFALALIAAFIAVLALPGTAMAQDNLPNVSVEPAVEATPQLERLIPDCLDVENNQYRWRVRNATDETIPFTLTNPAGDEILASGDAAPNGDTVVFTDENVTTFPTILRVDGVEQSNGRKNPNVNPCQEPEPDPELERLIPDCFDVDADQYRWRVRNATDEAIPFTLTNPAGDMVLAEGVAAPNGDTVVFTDADVTTFPTILRVDGVEQPNGRKNPNVNPCAPSTGSITIVKDVIEGSKTAEFDFEIGFGDGAIGFILKDGDSRSFGELPAGDYVINETFPIGQSADWQALTADDIVCTSEGDSSSEYLPFGDEADTFGTKVTLAAGDDVTCTFKNRKEESTGDLSVQKYIDEDRNGVYDSLTEDTRGEGWTITVKQNDSVIEVGVTNATGQIIFEDLPVGEYTVCEEDRDGFTALSGLCQNVTVTEDGQTPLPLVFLNQPDAPQLERLIPDCFDAPANEYRWRVRNATDQPIDFTLTNPAGDLIFASGTAAPNGDTEVTTDAAVTTFPTILRVDGVEQPLGRKNPNVNVCDPTDRVIVTKTDDKGNPLENWDFVVNQGGGQFTTFPATDANGMTEVEIPFGNYEVCEILQPGWTNVTPLCQAITVGGEQSPIELTFVNKREERVCTDEDRDWVRDLKHEDSYIYKVEDGKAFGRVENRSEICDYPVGLASYEKFDEVIDNQELFAFNDTTVGPGETLDFHVDLPECSVQVDLYYGTHLPSLDGFRYGPRLLDAWHLPGNGYCEGEIIVIEEPEEPEEPVNVAPVAEAGDSANIAATRSTLYGSYNLNGSASFDSDGEIVSYVWSIGSTTIATGVTPMVNLSMGTHTIVLTVTDDDGASATDSITITVDAPEGNRAPSAFIAPNKLDNHNYFVDGLGSSDPDGDAIVSYEWLVDGAVVSTDAVATLTLDIGGHTITLRVTDSFGAVGESSMRVVVERSIEISPRDPGDGGDDGEVGRGTPPPAKTE